MDGEEISRGNFFAVSGDPRAKKYFFILLWRLLH
jgi:hypothetical protein